VWLAIATRTRDTPIPLARRVDLYIRGFGPWYAWVLFVSGVCIFSWHARTAFFDVLGIPLFVALIALALAWSIVLTHACFLCGYRLTRRGALLRTVAFYVGFGGSLLIYYIVSDQLLNLFTVV